MKELVIYNPSNYLSEQREKINSYLRSLFYSSIIAYESQGIITKEYIYINYNKDLSYVLLFNGEFIIKLVDNISDNKEDDDFKDDNWLIHTIFIDHKQQIEAKKYVKTNEVFKVTKPVVSINSLYAIYLSYCFNQYVKKWLM